MSNNNGDHQATAKFETILTSSGVERRVPVEFRTGAIEREREIEEWLLKHFDSLKLDATLIGNQIELENNKAIDMLAVTRKGRLCVVELKRDRAERAVFGQILDYARWLSGFLIDQINALCSQHKQAATTLSEIYAKYFSIGMPAKRDRNPLLVVLAEDFSPSEIQMALYLNQEHKFCIRLISYEAKLVDGDLTMKFRHEVLPTDRLRLTSKKSDQVFEMRFHESAEWTWEKCKKDTVIPVSDEIAARIQEYKNDGPLSLLVYLDKHGYVASGAVKEIKPGYVAVGTVEKIVDVRSDGEAGGNQLKMDWDVAVEFGDAVFRDKTEQPTEELQELIDEDKWSILVGLIRFNAERIRRRQPHGGKRRPYKRHVKGGKA